MKMNEKTGYLREPLKLFYLRDQKDWQCPYHYHDFDKLTLFLQGHVTYEIEGTSYQLKPYDIVLVKAGQIHRPLIAGTAVYERIIAYISPGYIESYNQRNPDLGLLFHRHTASVLRQPQDVGIVYGASCRLRQAFASRHSPTQTLLQETIFLEFLIYVATAIREKQLGYVKTGEENEKIRFILTYIADHLTEDLSIPSLAKAAYISSDYLMHLFKEETGFSLGNYITAKRLQKARLLLAQGLPLTTVCYDAGFNHYSTFYRAWKKQYQTAPTASKAIALPPEQSSYDE